MSDQIFPAEIEYMIFMDALAIKGISESAVNLILVAKRIHMWLIPKLTETFAIRTFPPAQNYPTSWDVNIATLTKYGIHTRNLFIWISPFPSSPYHDPLAAEYISLCPNLTNLVLWSAHSMDLPTPQLDAIANLQALTHLSLNLKKISSSDWENPKLIRVLNRITHLHSVMIIASEQDITMFKHFTSVTHFVFPYPSDEDLVPRIWETLPTVEVLILLDYTNVDHISVRHDSQASMDDPKTVRIACRSDNELDEWLLDVQKGRGFWGIADQAVRERRKQKAELHLQRLVD
ncbi:hypothetical protein BDN72DRAFT_963657 [Pluteus cervinus]|uniref:Uncharacterized protein n=1 Tax=Pluteus cervinus TaxID=181527 RepID=A0ACD3ADS7_9AGAR|nr:hypothetical protein BDN72DRAFT_963657 [Pluteus cervinus]